MTIDTMEQHEALVAAMLDPQRWPAGGADRERIDTHISTVVLAGEHAYKLKKPLALGFLDFSTLEAREQACREELRLNRRLAPAVYEAVCRVNGTPEYPVIDGEGQTIDWLVRMRRFDPHSILSERLQRLTPRLVIGLAELVADFHAGLEPAASGQSYGSPDTVWQPVMQNFTQLVEVTGGRDDRLQRLSAWSRAEYQRLAESIGRRRDQGHVRECHGDLHLGNVALIDERPVVFDAIEFDPALRWIDTVNDAAFLFMDLWHRVDAGLAHAFLDRYLQRGGDYDGLPLLRFYAVYRALVRAKIAAIRLGQDLAPAAADAARAEVQAYVALAGDLSRGHRGAVVITRGLSGSGKSHLARQLPQHLPAVCLRSDVERKRLLGLAAEADAGAHDGYTAERTAQTYDRLAALATGVVGAGYVAVVDATFLEAERRDRFRRLADSLGVPFVILDCAAPERVLRERIAARRTRADNVSDADFTVLERQLAHAEPLSDSERRRTLTHAPERPLDWADLHRRVAIDADIDNGV
jgi:aminoglycoside phosphotransferase family enzyme/predicted kinase